MRTLLVLFLVGGAALLLMGQRTPPRDTPVPSNPPQETVPVVRAQAFHLVDAQGSERAALVTDGGGSVFLVLFDRSGKARAEMQVSNYGPSLNFYDPNAKTRLVIGSTTLVASHVAIDGIVERYTPSSIVLFDAAGKLLWRNP